MTRTSAPLLSLILCSRNDSYLGNSRWRLQTTLNYAGRQIEALGRGSEVEIVVADWGSEEPLSSAIPLLPSAARVVKFVWIPPALAVTLQGDSPFPEVLALNAAARRARGRFIGRIDQDTLPGQRFIGDFLDWAAREESSDIALAHSLLFANRRSIPYRFAVGCPPLDTVERFIDVFGSRLRVEVDNRQEFYRFDVGVWLLHRALWDACGGYDERMVFMNDMETDMIARLMTTYPMVDLGKQVAFDFFHLDHYHPGGSRSSSTHREVNVRRPREPRGMNPNGAAWGLAACDLPVVATSAAVAVARTHRGPMAVLFFWGCVGRTGLWMALDHLHYQVVRRWGRRGVKVCHLYGGRPVAEWPAVTAGIWRKLFPGASARLPQ